MYYIDLGPSLPTVRIVGRILNDDDTSTVWFERLTRTSRRYYQRPVTLDGWRQIVACATYQEVLPVMYTPEPRYTPRDFPARPIITSMEPCTPPETAPIRFIRERIVLDDYESPRIPAERMAPITAIKDPLMPYYEPLFTEREERPR